MLGRWPPICATSAPAASSETERRGNSLQQPRGEGESKPMPEMKQSVLSRASKRVGQLLGATALTVAATVAMPAADAYAQKRPNIVVLMSDDTGWADLGAYLGGAALGHPTPNLDRIAKKGALFTSWYGQASCTAGRASFMTGRIPIRSALS